MSKLVPNRFLFKFEFPLYRCAQSPRIDGQAETWDSRFLLPTLCELDGQRPFGQVWATWDDEGFYAACRVEGKTRFPHGDPTQFWKSDGLRLMIDLRDTRNIRRATRFCRQFYFLPMGGGAKGKEPCAGEARIHRASQEAARMEAALIDIAARVDKTGYGLTARLPASALNGFDPLENPRIGFYYMLEDAELGQQFLTVGDDLNWWMDPSTWPTAVLRK